METSVSDSLSNAVIGGESKTLVLEFTDETDFLYGDADGKDLPTAFADEAEHAEFAKYTEKDWINLLDK